MAIFIRDLPEADLDKLTDRELMELTCRTVNQLKSLLVVHQQRIDSLEVWRTVLSTGITVVLAISSILLAKLSKIF